MTKDARERWATLSEILDHVQRAGVASLSTPDVKRLGSLYRQVTIDLSQARTRRQGEPELVQYLSHLAARAHGAVYQAQPVGGGLMSVVWFVLGGFPRLVRQQWPALAVASGVFVVVTLLTMGAVVAEPDRAYALFDEQLANLENKRLESHTGEYKGNFTFTFGQSPLMAVAIIANNIRVAVIGFALGALLCLPGLLLLAYQGRMVGVLAGVLHNNGHLMGLCALLVGHGVLELSAFCIAFGAGLRLGWAVIAPGQRERRAAFRTAAGEAFGLLAGTALMLVVAGIIEAFVTPHFDATTRWTVGISSGVFMLLYFAFAGRGARWAKA